MPQGVYRGKPAMTAEEKKKSEAARRKRYREKHGDQIKAARKRYHAENQDLLRAKSNRYYAENRESMKEQAREHYAKTYVPKTPQQKPEPVPRDKYLAEYYRTNYRTNRELILARQRQYRKDHPESHRRRNAKRRAVKKNAPIGDLAAIVNWESTWRSGKTVACHWCRKRVKTSDVHVDHVVPLSKGGAHDVENMCVACAKCNLSKHAKSPDVWNSELSQPLLFV